MTEIIELLRPYLMPVIFISAGFISAFIFNRVILHRLEHLATRTRWSFDDIVLKSLRHYLSFWLILTGLYLANTSGSIPDFMHGPANKILLVITILSITFAIASLTASIVTAYTAKFGTRFQNSALFVNIVRGIIIIMGIGMLLQTFGISITPVLGAMGIGSLAAGFALKDTLANFFAGIQILASKQLRTGDFIQLSDGQRGYITDITLRNTTLISRDNNTIVVPNAQLAIETVLNLNIPMENIRVKIDCGVAYDSDLDLVENVVMEVAEHVMKHIEGGIPDFKPRFRFHTFADFSINFTIILRAADYPAQWTVRNAFIKLLKKRFDEEGIEIPFPIRTLIQQ